MRTTANHLILAAGPAGIGMRALRTEEQFGRDSEAMRLVQSLGVVLLTLIAFAGGTTGAAVRVRPASGAAGAGYGASASGHDRAGEGLLAVLAVDREQHESCGVRGVSAGVPGRGVQRAGSDPPQAAARCGQTRRQSIMSWSDR